MAKRPKKWTAPEERRLLQLIESQPDETLVSCFITFSRESGRTVKAVNQHYYKSMRSQALPASPEGSGSSASRKWTSEEDNILLRYMDNMGISNLHAVFLAVSEQIGRTPGAIASHWYSVISKRKDVQQFARASKKDVLWNRKNGVGIPSDISIWRRILRVLKNL